MLQFCLKIVLFSLCALVSCVAPLNIHAQSLTSSSAQADLLLDHLFAVHATRNLPDTDYLRAGWATKDLTSLQKSFLPQVRQTLHFSLGELVRPIEGFMDWEDCSYAVVTPLRTLLPQLINLNCYDTFILGDLKLTLETYLVVPCEGDEKLRSQATVITYDPQNKTLRQAVDELILSYGGWHIEMNSDDLEDELHAAYLEGKNINTPEFFQPLKQGRPWIAVGLRFDPLDGEHYRLSQIEQNLLCFSMQLSPLAKIETEWPALKNSDLEKLIATVQTHFAHWSESLAGFTWGPESQRAFQQISIEIENWCCLIREELRVRKLYGKTLMRAPEEFLIECIHLLAQPAALQIFIDQNRQKLLEYTPK